MYRSPSRLAQFCFNIVNRLSYLSRHSDPVGQFLARALNRIGRSALKQVGTGHLVQAEIYGHRMAMPSEHTIAHTLQIYPQYNRPLGLAAVAIANQPERKPGLAVVDIGANIGETVAIIDQRCAGIASYLCIDADKDLVQICTSNHSSNDRVETKLSFIGEKEGQLVQLIDDGRANPSTKLAQEDNSSEYGYGRLVRLDTIAASFAKRHGGIDLIKVDTEGYDFSILRSGSELLSKYRPALYFEWYPKLLSASGENPWEGFDFLQRSGYHFFVFFTSIGDYYCKVSDPRPFLLESLAHITLRDNMYFDVFTADSELLCDELVRLSVEYEQEGIRA